MRFGVVRPETFDPNTHRTPSQHIPSHRAHAHASGAVLTSRSHGARRVATPLRNDGGGVCLEGAGHEAHQGGARFPLARATLGLPCPASPPSTPLSPATHELRAVSALRARARGSTRDAAPDARRLWGAQLRGTTGAPLGDVKAALQTCNYDAGARLVACAAPSQLGRPVATRRTATAAAFVCAEAALNELKRRGLVAVAKKVRAHEAALSCLEVPSREQRRGQSTPSASTHARLRRRSQTKREACLHPCSGGCGRQADRTAAEGLVGISADGRHAVVVEVNSETDFVGRSSGFQARCGPLSLSSVPGCRHGRPGTRRCPADAGTRHRGGGGGEAHDAAGSDEARGRRVGARRSAVCAHHRRLARPPAHSRDSPAQELVHGDPHFRA